MKRLFAGILMLLLLLFAACTPQEGATRNSAGETTETVLLGEKILPQGEEGNTQFNSYSGGNIVRSGDYYYYISGQKSAIYRCNTNGKEPFLLYRAENLRGLSLTQGRLYFLKDMQLYRIDLDGQNMQRLSSDARLSEYQLYGDRIYYNLSGVFLSMNLDGSVVGKRTFPDAHTATDYTLFQGDIFYFANSPEPKSKTLVLYQHNLETDERTVLHENIKSITNGKIWVTADRLYFHSYDNGGRADTFKIFDRAEKKVLGNCNGQLEKINLLGNTLLTFNGKSDIVPVAEIGEFGGAITQQAKKNGSLDVIDDALFCYDIELKANVLLAADGSLKVTFEK